MTDEQLLTHELSHRHIGNGYAAVEIQPPTKSTVNGKSVHWVLVTDKWCKKGQAFLAARDFLEIHQMSPGKDPATGNPLPPEPVKLTDEELAKLQPWRDGIANSSLKVVSTRFEKAKGKETR